MMKKLLLVIILATFCLSVETRPKIRTFYLMPSTPDSAEEATREAAKDWNKLGCRLREVGNMESANIVIFWLNTPEEWPPDRDQAELALTLLITQTESFILLNGHNLSEYDVRTIAAHELGHSLGLGHTSRGLMKRRFHRTDVIRPGKVEKKACRE